MSTGNALAMRLKLTHLGVQHRVASQGEKLPLFDPTPHDMVLEGYCATDDLDHDRTKLRKYAFGYPLLFRHRYPPLYLKHDTSREVGRIDDLVYDELGNLQIWCTVTDHEAKRYPAFSIAATVNEYEICDGTTKNFHALIKSATITEISLTDNPSNPFALVMDRYRVSPAVQTYELLSAKMKCLQQLATLIQKGVHHTPVHR